MTDGNTLRCPATPLELGLDKPTWRPGQRETVDAILDAFIAGKKFVLAAIPTGGGKTIVGAAVQTLLAQAGIGNGQSVALTHTIQLQQQYRETLRHAAVLTGRGNHLCELPAEDFARIGYDDMGKPLTAADAPCSVGEGCSSGLKHADGCGYYRQFYAAIEAPMVIMNYAYAARILQLDYVGAREDPDTGERTPILNPFRRALLIADECHLAERAVMDAAAVTLNGYTIRKLGFEVPSEFTQIAVQEGRKIRRYENTHTWVEWSKLRLPEAQEKLRTISNAIRSVQKSLEEEPDQRNRERLANLRADARYIGAMIESLKTLSEITPEEEAEWLLKRETLGRSTRIVAQPLWGWSSAPRLLWQHYDRVLLMSATPGDPEVARVTLGIPKEEFVFIERPSTFPVENRPVYFWNVAKLSYTSTDYEWDLIARAIARIASGPAHLTRKGLVHSGSKANARKIAEMLQRHIPGRKIIVEGQEGMNRAADTLLEFKQSDEPCILITASFTTGLDLPYMIGWQVIAKVPFGSLADDITARRKAFVASDGYKLGQQVYQSEAMNTVVQASGRAVRAEDDMGPTYILDGNYVALHARAYAPAFYREAFRRLEVAAP